MLLGNGLRFRDLFYDKQLVDKSHCNLDILNDLINGNKKDMVHPVLWELVFINFGYQL